jgi:DNA excision repair protein ERCC-4
MAVPEDQDGKSDICVSLQRDLKSPTKNTRQGGRGEDSTRKFVIVDMREFRSELPALIHKRGVDIEPVTIAVGDYILTPEICVERKSLSDLVGSLNSGRMYQQCTQMFRYYAKPMLLIEFDQNKPFSWQNQYMVSTDSSNFDIQKKLLLLTLHFPKLKIVWSPSPYASAQLFEELKVRVPQGVISGPTLFRCRTGRKSPTWNTRLRSAAIKIWTSSRPSTTAIFTISSRSCQGSTRRISTGFCAKSKPWIMRSR